MQNNTFETNFNNIISNNYQKALDGFKDAYLSTPDEISFIHGVIVSSFLADKYDELVEFLRKEKEISTLSTKIRLIYTFIIKNLEFKNHSPNNQILNLGLYLKNSGYIEESKIYFKTSQILEPGNHKNLTVLAESAIREGNFDKGIRLFTQAAKESAGKI